MAVACGGGCGSDVAAHVPLRGLLERVTWTSSNCSQCPGVRLLHAPGRLYCSSDARDIGVFYQLYSFVLATLAGVAATSDVPLDRNIGHHILRGQWWRAQYISIVIIISV